MPIRKKKILLSLLLLPCLHVYAQPSIHVTIHNVRNANGFCTIALYADAQNFLKPAKALKSKKIRAQKGVVHAEFDNVSPGTYAIAVIHDENSDNKLNTNFIGIPKEGYGASNNRLPMTSAPTFQASSFVVDGRSKELSINLKYY